MLYEQLNNLLPYNQKLNQIYNTIEKIAKFAEKNNLKYYICGGTALAIFCNSIYRKNGDIEFSVDYNEKDIWFNFLEENQFKFERNGLTWPLGNQKICYKSKDEFNVEIILLKNNNINKDYITVNINKLNININDPLKIFETKMFYPINKKNKKQIRPKDKRDLVKFKQYLLDIIQKSE